VGAVDPTLTITETRRGEWSFAGLSDPTVNLDDPAGCEAIPWTFEWEATPGDPNTTISAYRYGFDIVDLNDDSEWWTDWCDCLSALPVTFYFGVHTFHVEVKDNTGAVSRGAIRMNMIPTSAPPLTVTEATRGSWLFVGTDGPIVQMTDEITDPITPWTFEWEAVACGSPPATFTYRYGWDIADPDDDNQWSDWGDLQNSPPILLYDGLHVFRVEARDETGAVSRGTIWVEVTQSTVPVKLTTWGEIKAQYSE
jgi:hypothetical protein